MLLAQLREVRPVLLVAAVADDVHVPAAVEQAEELAHEERLGELREVVGDHHDARRPAGAPAAVTARGGARAAPSSASAPLPSSGSTSGRRAARRPISDAQLAQRPQALGAERLAHELQAAPRPPPRARRAAPRRSRAACGSAPSLRSASSAPVDASHPALDRLALVDACARRRAGTCVPPVAPAEPSGGSASARPRASDVAHDVDEARVGEQLRQPATSPCAARTPSTQRRRPPASAAAARPERRRERRRRRRLDAEVGGVLLERRVASAPAAAPASSPIQPPCRLQRDRGVLRRARRPARSRRSGRRRPRRSAAAAARPRGAARAAAGRGRRASRSTCCAGAGPARRLELDRRARCAAATGRAPRRRATRSALRCARANVISISCLRAGVPIAVAGAVVSEPWRMRR